MLFVGTKTVCVLDDFGREPRLTRLEGKSRARDMSRRTFWMTMGKGLSTRGGKESRMRHAIRCRCRSISVAVAIVLVASIRPVEGQQGSFTDV